MTLLLDTNILLRLMFDPRRLSRAAVRRIEGEQAVYVSAISIFEIGIKASKRKLDIDREKLEAGLIEAGLNPLPFTLQHALRVQDIAPAHPDPFDRALLAQAMAEPIYLLTTDEALARYSQLVIVA
jgi:PIN domain nuclease of toxin-antitoxin system